MRQIVQHMGSGLTEVLEAPAPTAQAGSLLIQTTCSLISAGSFELNAHFVY